MEKENIDSKHDQQEEKLSICDIMKEDTSEVIKKMESKMPSMFQSYSDMYTKYLHTLDDVFGTCYIAEKEFFDNNSHVGAKIIILTISTYQSYPFLSMIL